MAGTSSRLDRYREGPQRTLVTAHSLHRSSSITRNRSVLSSADLSAIFEGESTSQELGSAAFFTSQSKLEDLFSGRTPRSGASSSRDLLGIIVTQSEDLEVKPTTRLSPYSVQGFQRAESPSSRQRSANGSSPTRNEWPQAPSQSNLQSTASTPGISSDPAAQSSYSTSGIPSTWENLSKISIRRSTTTSALLEVNRFNDRPIEPSRTSHRVLVRRNQSNHTATSSQPQARHSQRSLLDGLEEIRLHLTRSKSSRKPSDPTKLRTEKSSQYRFPDRNDDESTRDLHSLSESTEVVQVYTPFEPNPLRRSLRRLSRRRSRPVTTGPEATIKANSTSSSGLGEERGGGEGAGPLRKTKT
mmetsp:Transcript_16161/g.32710  ORF Transcript_16161/g.32710 Transcript_16161/m.32710 type:complete len:357 (+) Transcript_16161:4079-5149(+)